MSENESKIIQLLKSDDNYNRVLGLMLGKNELGVGGLLDLIEDDFKPRYECPLKIIIDEDVYFFIIGQGDITTYRVYKNYTEDRRFGHIYDNRITKFAKFINLVTT